MPDPIFNVQGTNVPQVTERNTPSTINAVYNFRNFWDGRAQNEFNGVNPFGSRNPGAYVLKAPTKQSPLQQVKISLKNSSLASQAVGPPLSSVEESATGRVFADVGQKFDRIKVKKLPRETGKKLRVLAPLSKQLVHPEVGRNGISDPQPNFLGVSPQLSTTTITPPSSTNPLEGSITEQDCPPGSKPKFVSGGYMCVTK